MIPALPQCVVVYDSPKGKGLVYGTAYTQDQEKQVVKSCVRDHGKSANVRCVVAKDHAKQ